MDDMIRRESEQRARLFESWMKWCLSTPMTPTRMMTDKPYHLYRYLVEKCAEEGVSYY